MSLRDPIGRAAIVIGGSVAGLLAARVLADHFESVTIVERDGLDDTARPRKGVPQGHHVHGILHRGRSILADLFPGLLEELLESGATRIDVSRDLAWYHVGQWKLRIPSGVYIQTQTRPFLEQHLRRRVRAHPRVRLVDRCQVTDFLAGAAQTRIQGVRVQPLGGPQTAAEWPADLVVDATGRGSHTPRWLEKLGYARPAESIIEVDVGYATRLFTRSPRPDREWKALMVYPTPPRGTRMGVLFPVEGERWVASVIGWVGDHAPADPAGYLEFARNLEAPDFHEAIKDEIPLSAVQIHKFPSNVRRHYERMTRFPGGLIVLGDALCSFNPSYGQGMTTSALAAEALRDELEAGRALGRDIDAIAQRFRSRVARVLTAPWTMAAGEDLLWPEVKGYRPPGSRLVNAYFGAVHRLTARDPATLLRYARVGNMVDPLHKIFSPYIMFRVAASALGRGSRRANESRVDRDLHRPEETARCHPQKK